MKSEGPLVRDFAATFCRHAKGEWAGQPVVFDSWQAAIIDDLFALDDTGRRKHRTGLIGMPRKNGKSLMGSAFALYGLVGEGEPGAQVFACAGDRQQARIVFEEAKKMVLADPELSQVVKVFRDVLEYQGSTFRVLAADAKLQQGLNPSMVIFDELHVQPNDDLWTAMTMGSGTRRQPIVIAITTAGYDQDSLCYRLYEHGQRTIEEPSFDPSFYFHWIEPIEPGCDYREPAVFRACNPAVASGFRKEDDFLALINSSPENEVRRFMLNQWTAADQAWLEYGAWDRCRVA